MQWFNLVTAIESTQVFVGSDLLSEPSLAVATNRGASDANAMELPRPQRLCHQHHYFFQS
jgi:hypothetical protein